VRSDTVLTNTLKDYSPFLSSTLFYCLTLTMKAMYSENISYYLSVRRLESSSILHCEPKFSHK